jgi:hypothetical protein
VSVRLDIPHRVLFTRILVASDFLLFETPVRQLDFVTEQVAARQDVPQPEPSSKGLKLLLGERTMGFDLIDFDLEVIVRVSFETIESVRRDFVLVVDFGDGCTNVVRVELLRCRNVVEDED